MKQITIATRGSKLALWQAEHVKACLTTEYPQLEVELLVIKTQGDKILDVPLAKVGGKGLFVKEIEEALLNGIADIAVHSLKDVPMVLPEKLILGAYLERESPYDLFLSEKYSALEELPPNAVLGTSSLRRQAQALAIRPDLEIKLLRGNVETRLRKMKEGEYDAIILAAAGIKRLELNAHYREPLAPPLFLPAVGQGALALEIHQDRYDIQGLIDFLNHKPTQLCVEAERAFMRTLEGGCQVPIAGYATMISNNTLCLKALIADVHGKKIIRQQIEGSHPEKCGVQLANALLNSGGRELLSELLTY